MGGRTIRRETPPPMPAAFAVSARVHQRIACAQSSIAALPSSRFVPNGRFTELSFFERARCCRRKKEGEGGRRRVPSARPRRWTARYPGWRRGSDAGRTLGEKGLHTREGNDAFFVRTEKSCARCVENVVIQPEKR